MKDCDLCEIQNAIHQNWRVYRKSPLGRAGQVYGDTGRLHFEIVCDDKFRLARLTASLISGPR